MAARSGCSAFRASGAARVGFPFRLVSEFIPLAKLPQLRMPDFHPLQRFHVSSVQTPKSRLCMSLP